MKRVLERVLKFWKILKDLYCKENKTRVFPLDSIHDSLVEFYSILEAMSEVTLISQAKNYPSGAASLLAFVELRLTIFNWDGDDAHEIEFHDPG